MSKFEPVEQLFLQTYNELNSTDYKLVSEIPEQNYTGDAIRLMCNNYYYRLLPEKVIRNERLTRQVKNLKRTVKILFVLLCFTVYLLFR